MSPFRIMRLRRLPLHPRRLLIILLSIALLTACRSKRSFAPSLWFYRSYDVSATNWDSLISRFSYLHLKADSSFTQDFGQFNYGKWRLLNNDLYLTNQHNVTYVYHLPSIRENELGFFLGKDKVAWLQRQPKTSADADLDPFSLDNNRWRIPATHKETVAEIRQRLLNHLHFWETYFKWGAASDIGAMYVREIPTPLKIYGNGFGLKHYRDLSPRWKSCFFDSVDCHIADTLIKGAFKRNNIKWPDTDEQIDKFISGIQQVEGFLR
jgi:hypothetical protein